MIKIISLVFFLCLFIGNISSREPYRATFSSFGSTGSTSAPNLVDLNRNLRSDAISQVLPFYTPNSPLSLDFNIRGILALTFFPPNSTTLFVQIPQAGTTTSFTGSTREESLTLLKDFIRDGGHHHRLLKAYARFSPIDPIAGNPDSLMSLMGQSDYLLGHLSPLSGCACDWTAQPIVHQFQAGMNVERAFSRGFDTTAVTAPLRYSYSPNLNWALIIDAPLRYLRNGGSSSLVGSIGLGLRIPVTHGWSLTSIARLGSGGTLDLCTAGNFASFGLLSVYDYKVSPVVFSLINYASYITSTNFWLTGVNFNYRLQSYLLKNGLSITSCKGVNFCGRPINGSISFVDTYFTKGKLFIRHYDEVTLSLIANFINPRLDYDSLILGFTYQFGEKDFKSYSFNLAYQF